MLITLALELRPRNCFYRVKLHRKKGSLRQFIFFSVTRKEKLFAIEFPMTRTLKTIKRRYEIVGEWRLSILKHHSQPTNHIMVRWHEFFFLAFVMIWVICLISFALKTFRNQGKWFLRAVGPWRPFLAIEIRPKSIVSFTITPSAASMAIKIQTSQSSDNEEVQDVSIKDQVDGKLLVRHQIFL